MTANYPVLNNKTVSLINIIQIIIWTLAALCILPFKGHFLYDQAFFYEQAIHVAKSFWFPVYGPFISGTNPSAYTPGGGYFLLQSFPFFFSPDPRLGIAWLIILSSLGLWLFDYALKASARPPLLRLIIITLLNTTVWHAEMVSSIWNPHVFWFLSLSLLSITLLLLSGNQSFVFLSFCFGLISAFLMQTHLGGSLAVLTCFLAIVVNHKHIHLKKFLLFGCLAGFLMYLPYFYSEISNGFLNTQRLSSAPRYTAKAVGQSLYMPFIHISQYFWKDELRYLMDLDPSKIMKFFVFVLGGIFLLIGIIKKHSLRVFCLTPVILSPVFYAFVRRDFQDHYVASIIPFLYLAPATAATWLFSYKKFRYLSAIYVLFFSLGSTYVWIERYMLTNHHIKISDRLQQAQQALQQNPISIPSDLSEAFILWTIAKNVYHQELAFLSPDHPGKKCKIKITNAPRSSDIFVNQSSYLDCENSWSF